MGNSHTHLVAETVETQEDITPVIDRKTQLREIQDEALELFSRKNKDYGDAFAQYGCIGVLVRMQDKLARFQNISQKKIVLVDDERLRDTLIDLHNYSAMAIMLLDEKEKED